MSLKPDIEHKRKRENIHRKDKILRSAREVMLIKGYVGATMDEIAADAGLTKPTLYQYFKTKDELFSCLVEPLIKSLALKLEKIRITLEEKQYNSGRDIIRDIFDVYYRTFESDPGLFKLFWIFLQLGFIYTMEEGSAVEMKIWGKKCFSEGSMIASLSAEQGFIRESDVYLSSDYVWGSFCGIVQLEQNRWKKEGISPFLKPVLQYAENLLASALIIR